MSLRLVGIVLALVVVSFGTCVGAADSFELIDGERVVFLGDGLIEQEQYSGWVELALTSAYPSRDITFRNLGWSADTPAGVSRCGLSLMAGGNRACG